MTKHVAKRTVREGARIALHTLAGAAAGYVALHPLSMSIHGELGSSPSLGVVLSRCVSLEHLPMAAFFASIGAVAGMVDGVRSVRLRRLLARVQQLSITDELTQLANRRHLMRTLAAEIERARRYDLTLSLLMIDVDHFKRYNDEHGHVAGDRLLRRLAARLVANTRATDIVARYGGEEFVVVMLEAPAPLALATAQRLRRDVEQANLGVTLSLGVAQMDRDGANIGSLIADADAAMYRAKAAGRNAVRVAIRSAPCRGQRHLARAAARG